MEHAVAVLWGTALACVAIYILACGPFVRERKDLKEGNTHRLD